MNRMTRRLLTGAGVAAAGAAAFAAVSYSFTKKLVRIALDREAPKASAKAQSRLTGSEGHNRFSEIITDSARRLSDSDCETLTVMAFDGERLVGHLHRCAKPRRIIIAMHGWRSSWSNDFGTIADFWHSSGCTVLYAEQRGQNNSGGNHMGFGMVERHDCLRWVEWVNENLDASLPVYLAGISMGASTVLMAAGLELPENVCGIIADCGYTSPHAIWKHVAENNLHLSYGLVGLLADDMCKRKINLGTRDCSTLEALEKGTVPVLLIHGSDDHFVPIEMTYENYKVCTAPKRLLVVPGAEHSMSYLVDKSAYEEAVRRFWRDFDRRPEQAVLNETPATDC